jgi:ABC-2 type transport system permease protein
MAVYGHTYRPYGGPTTPEWSRFVVLPRYAFEEVFRSRLFIAFLVVCFLPPLVGSIIVYLRHNASALAFMELDVAQILPIDALFFQTLLRIQGTMAFLLTLFVGPALVSPDLRNGAMPLYLSRPFTRREYVLGKLTVLAVLLSAVTWVPMLLLFGLQVSLEKTAWLAGHAHFAWAIFAGSWVWILVLSLFALAISAWVKWRPVARITLVVLFIVLAGFGTAINETLDTYWGTLFNMGDLIEIVWSSMFGLGPQDSLASSSVYGTLPVWAAWTALGATCLAALGLLSRRIRAFEVVR